MSASKEDWQVAALEAGMGVDRCRQKLRRSEKARERIETAARALLDAYEAQGAPLPLNREVEELCDALNERD